MRVAILSDVHGNQEALLRVIDRIHAERCDRTICLGDSVGYGPFPDECVELVHKASAVVLAGNHDHALVGRTSSEYFNEYARQALSISAPLMNAHSLERLRSYPLIWEEADVLYVHATPYEPQAWHYLLNAFDAVDQWQAFSQTLCFIGHSHQPAIFSCGADEVTALSVAAELVLEPETRYLVNVGSVGQPRDRNPDASFVIYDDEEKRIQWIRVPYDVQVTQRAMRKLHLPDFLIRRLSFGY